MLAQHGVSFHTFKDQVIFEKDEVVKGNGDPYLVYTPYSKKWLDSLSSDSLESYTSALQFDNWSKHEAKPIIPLEKMGFKASSIPIPNSNLTDHTLTVYETERDSPPKDSTSRLGIHLRFGTISVRQLAKRAQGKSLIFLKELIWREFFMMILYHYPKVVDHNFNAKYNALEWRNKEEEFDRWCKGETGYLLVDAGMRELNKTGFMHNRVRMLVASFLTKHLLIDWRWGEAYFAEKLLDYELSSNNGNWQWAAGTGVDAAPYFRVFNPITQVDKFDKDHLYIKRWIEDYGSSTYPTKMVEHKFARERALETYKAALNNS
jgi:deoxyribodipyrimidine photo-lyase